MFHKGDVVECVNAAGAPILTEHGVYSVRACFQRGDPSPVGTWPGPDVVMLHKLALGEGYGFLANRFRLLKRRDPSLMKQLLGPPSV